MFFTGTVLCISSGKIFLTSYQVCDSYDKDPTSSLFIFLQKKIADVEV